jgi:PAS domain S-box-containing protein
MSATSHKLPAAAEIGLLQAKFGSVLESVPEAIVMINSEGRIVFANQHAEKLFGYAPGELPGLSTEILLPGRFRSSFTGRIQNCFAHSHEPSIGAGLELFGARKEGSEFPAEFSLNPVRTEDGAWATTAIRDITHWKHLQEELKVKSTALEAANQELQAFSYSISHDLRAPLRAMDGFANMLKKSLGPDLSKESEHSLKRIQDNVTKMSRLIEGLLDFSTLTWVALTKRHLNLVETAQKTFDELTRVAAHRRVDFAIGKMPDCKADAMLLRQVFTHLLSNALKFTRDRDPAVIRIGCHDQNGEIVYFVQDNGAGFDMEYADKLFQVFQRLHSPSEFEGTGVGLAIVQRIVQRHGGRIWAEAKTDQGATFNFTLGETSHGHTA